MARSTHVLLGLLSLAGCGDDASVVVREPATGPRERPEPVAPAAELPEPTPIAIPTADGLELAADLALGRDDGAMVVLFHQLGADRSEWAPVAEGLRRAGHTVLRIDLRGHGASPGGPDGWREFDAEDWDRLAADGEAVVAWARLRPDLPSKWVFGGSSIGSSVAIRAAAAEEVDGVFVLSPGRAYHGIDALTPIADYPAERPLLALAAGGEVASAETAREMARIAPSGSARLADGSAHGLAMLEEQPGLLSVIEDFVTEVAR